MTDFTAPNNFTNGTTADATQLEADWTALETFINITGVPLVQDGTITPAKLSFDPATQSELDSHVNDTTSAHAASAISIVDSGSNYTATDVEAALAEVHDSLEAVSAGGVADASITSAKLAANSVTAAKLARPHIVQYRMTSSPALSDNVLKVLTASTNPVWTSSITPPDSSFVAWDATNYRPYAVVAGLFRLTYAITLQNGTGSDSSAYVEYSINGLGSRMNRAVLGSSYYHTFTYSRTLSLSANDYILISCLVDFTSGSGAALADGSTGTSFVELEYVGPAT